MSPPASFLSMGSAGSKDRQYAHDAHKIVGVSEKRHFSKSFRGLNTLIPQLHRVICMRVYGENVKLCPPPRTKVTGSWAAVAQLLWKHHSFTGTTVMVIICFLGLAQTCQVLALKACREIHHISMHSFPYAEKLPLRGNASSRKLLTDVFILPTSQFCLSFSCLALQDCHHLQACRLTWFTLQCGL